MQHTHYAGFWKRFGAALIDGFIYGAIVYILYIISFLVLLVSGDSGTALLDSLGDEYAYENDDSIAGAVAFLIIYFGAAILVPWLYYTLFESSKMMGTPGKKILNLIIVDKHNQRISFGRANARYWSRILSCFTLYIGYMMAGFTEKKQTLHDKIARTYVIDQRLFELEQLRAQLLADSPSHNHTSM